MSCSVCGSVRIANINGKCSDLFSASICDKEHEGSVPEDMNIGGGDYIDFDYCLDCGQIQGDFPLELTELELGESDDTNEDDY